MKMARDGEREPLEQLGALVAQAREVAAPVVSAWAIEGLAPLEQIGRWVALARETPARLSVRAPLRGVMSGVDEARMVPELSGGALDARAGEDPHRALLETLRAEAASLGGPFEAKETVLGPFAHNPTVRQLPDGSVLLFMIGDGNTSRAPVDCM